MTDCCILGGGIVGLSLARELAGRGLSVRVITRDSPRDTASWAAAGIFPPAPDYANATANERLTAYSTRLHRTWAEDLLTETGIDNELDVCGGLHLAADEHATLRLREAETAWRGRGTRCDWLTVHDLAREEPALGTAIEGGRFIGGLLLPDEMRIRSPRHLEAVERSCRIRGVMITPAADIRRIDVANGRIAGIRIARSDGGSTDERVHAGLYCLAAGAWSGRLAESLGLCVETRPIRGQIALLRLPRQRLSRIVNVGLEYLVPRSDGRLLVGSTIEDAGYEPITTPASIQRLLAFAHALLGPLPEAILEQSWAGLRPGSVDGLPLIGAVPDCANAFLATGHFRAGLHQSTGTAVLLADLITGRPPAIDPTAFAPGRAPGPASPDSVEAFLARVEASGGDERRPDARSR